MSDKLIQNIEEGPEQTEPQASIHNQSQTMNRGLRRSERLHLVGVGKQMVVDPAGKDGRFHGHHPRLRQCSDPRIQLTPVKPILPSLCTQPAASFTQ